MMEAIEEWGNEIERALTSSSDADADPVRRFELTWTRVIESYSAHRQLWAATVEVATQAEHIPEIRAFLAEALQQGRLGLAALFQNVDATQDEKLARTVGSFYQALMSGVIVQWLIDPERAPSGADLAEALRIIVGSVQAAEVGSNKRD